MFFFYSLFFRCYKRQSVLLYLIDPLPIIALIAFSSPMLDVIYGQFRATQIRHASVDIKIVTLLVFKRMKINFYFVLSMSSATNFRFKWLLHRAGCRESTLLEQGEGVHKERNCCCNVTVGGSKKFVYGTCTKDPTRTRIILLDSDRVISRGKHSEKLVPKITIPQKIPGISKRYSK